MRVFYGTFFSGLGGGQFLHASLDEKTGVSILDHPYDCRFLFSQAVPGDPSGVLPKGMYNEGLRVPLNPGESFDLIHGAEDSEIRIVRDIPVSERVTKELRKIATYSFSMRRPKMLTTNDMGWVIEFASQYPEYIKSRLTDVCFKPEKVVA